MTATSRRFTLVALALGAVLAVVWTQREDDAPSVSTVPEGARRDAPPPAEATAPEGPALAAEPITAKDSKTKRARPAHRLIIRLVGIEASEAPKATGVFHRTVGKRGDPWIYLQFDENKEAVVDQDPLRTPFTVEAVAMVDHPSYLPRQVLTRLLGTHDIDPSVDSEEVLEVPMVRAAVFLGRVVDEQGHPVAGAEVTGRHRDEPARSDVERSFDGRQVPTGDDGRFWLRLGATAVFLVLISRDGHTARAMEVAARLGDVVDLGEITLSRGVPLAGVVRKTGFSRASVLVSWYGPGVSDPMVHGPSTLWLGGSRAVEARVSKEPDSEGRFRIDGLEPGPYRVRVPAEDWGLALHPDAYAQVDFAVLAPREDLVIDAERSVLRVEVRSDESPLGGAVVAIDGRDTIRLETPSEGEVGVVLRAGRAHHVSVFEPRHETATLDITAAESGSQRLVRVELRPLAKDRPPERGPWLVAPEGAGLFCLGPDGVPLAVRCRLRSAKGVVVPVTFVERRPGVQILSEDRLGVGSPAYPDPPLAPGAYEAEFGGDGYPLVRQRFVVEEGGLGQVILKLPRQ